MLFCLFIVADSDQDHFSAIVFQDFRISVFLNLPDRSIRATVPFQLDHQGREGGASLREKYKICNSRAGGQLLYFGILIYAGQILCRSDRIVDQSDQTGLIDIFTFNDSLKPRISGIQISPHLPVLSHTGIVLSGYVCR